jgi:hypothetical protein
MYYDYKHYLEDITIGYDNHLIDLTNTLTVETVKISLPSGKNLTLLVKVSDSLGSYANYTTFVTVN